MKEIELIKNLRSLKSILPRTEYASHSKMIILSSQRKLYPQWGIVGRGILAESFNFGLSMVFVTVILVLVLGGATNLLKAIFLNNLPGVNTENLTIEVDAITKNIDVQLNEAEYYTVTAKETSIALKETSLDGPAHVNPLLIQNEIKTLDFENSKNSNIDDLLNKLSQ